MNVIKGNFYQKGEGDISGIIVLVIIVIAILGGFGIVRNFFGGSTKKQPIATMPIQTEQGKTSARQCQTNYSQCNQSCRLIGGGAVERAQCLDSCIRVLSECYSTCK